MKNNKNDDKIIIGKEELQVIIRRCLMTGMLDTNGNIVDALCGKAYTEVKYIEENMQNEKLFAFMAGYLYITLIEMGYSKEDIINITKKLENKIKSNDYDYEIALQAYEHKA
jgi:hypothetical protein